MEFKSNLNVHDVGALFLHLLSINVFADEPLPAHGTPQLLHFFNFALTIDLSSIKLDALAKKI